MAAGAVDFMAVAVVAASTAAEVDSMAAASADIAEVGVDLAGVAAGAVAGAEAGVGTAGAAAGVIQAGDAAGVGVIPVGVGGLALVGVGVPIGEATRMDMGMDIPIIPTIRTTQTMGRTVMRRRTQIAITVPAEIRVTIRSGKI